MILAAIDMGSNAVRLLINEVIEQEGKRTVFNKLNLVRVPLRLGFDVFEQGYIGQEKMNQILETMMAFQLLMKVYKVQGYKACATSAMRSAKNGPEIIAKIKHTTGIDIELISGSDEAAILYETHIEDYLDKKKSYLYIDVGGGSTELTLFTKNNIAFRKSFEIGTIRMLSGKIGQEQWEQFKLFIKNNTKDIEDIIAIGSGGNINKVFSLSKSKDGKPLSLDTLKNYYHELRSASVSERMELYNLRKDRADVIVPALQIFTSIMRWAWIDQIYIPKIGVADGLIKMLYKEIKVKSD